MTLGNGSGSRGVWTVAAVSALLVSCGPGDGHEITVAIGPTVTHFPTTSAYAEYAELSTLRNELRLTFADYAVSCEHWIPPRKDAHALTVVIVTPPKSPPKPGNYGWTGVAAEAGGAHAAYALPKLLVESSSRLFEPGGSVTLTALKLEPRGSVTGTLAFEFPGASDRPATRIAGTFDAKMCRFSKEER